MRNLVIRHTVGFAAALALAGVPAAVTASVVSSTGAGATTCVAGFSDAGGGWCSADFAATGAPTTVTLPMGANFQVRIDASGAEGGWSREDGIGEASHGGLGGRQTGTVLRPGGTTFTIVVGQQGGMVSGASWVPGGFGGGGAPSSIYGGGGGGGSFVFDGAGPIVVAGGGGGGGWDANPTWCANPANQESPGGAGAGAIGPAGTGASVAYACDTTFHGPLFEKKSEVKLKLFLNQFCKKFRRLSHYKTIQILA